MILADWVADLAAVAVAAVLAITLHEAAHGYAALALGDDTARQAGRLSLNPIRHVDRVGTILVPAALALIQLATVGRVDFIFGWAKPVPVDVWRLRSPFGGMALVAAAGPAMNFGLVALAFLLGRATGLLPLAPDWAPDWLVGFTVYFVLANLVFGLFNLVPVPPLDGSRILAWLLPRPLAFRYLALERAGLLIVLVVFFLLPRLVEGLDPLGWLLRHGAAPLLRLVLLSGGEGP